MSGLMERAASFFRKGAEQVESKKNVVETAELGPKAKIEAYFNTYPMMAVPTVDKLKSMKHADVMNLYRDFSAANNDLFAIKDLVETQEGEEFREAVDQRIYTLNEISTNLGALGGDLKGMAARDLEADRVAVVAREEAQKDKRFAADRRALREANEKLMVAVEEDRAAKDEESQDSRKNDQMGA
ncbi:MAG: hypothetical protein WAZ14_01245 [Patescibacteria group bacterium]